MRGERFYPSTRRTRQHGSSPHARGTPQSGQRPECRPRFIPACAGNALSADAQGRPGTVHPRMRGERHTVFSSTVRLFGSSPHARGTLKIWQYGKYFFRFIPACAGNAVTGAASIGLNPVHPRMRGERKPQRTPVQGNAGSSPHARGTHGPEDRQPTRGRFIPACAGNAREGRRCRAVPAVHPRMRGERALSDEEQRRMDGSSPHARGTPTTAKP